MRVGMVGYPESLTDPSYSSQILILTYPLVGNYGVPERPPVAESAIPAAGDAHNVLPPTHLLDSLPLEFESSHIHIAALVVANYHPSFSHHLASSSLGQWLKEQGIPAIWGVDTRMLTKRIREGGVLLGRVLSRQVSAAAEHKETQTRVLGGVNNLLNSLSGSSILGSNNDDVVANWRDEYHLVPFHDPNDDNLVAKVSTKQPTLYTATTGSVPKVHPKTGRPMRVVAVDVGMKWNQIRCFRNRGIEVKVVPWVSQIIYFPDYLLNLNHRITTLTPSRNPSTVCSSPTVLVIHPWSKKPLATFPKPSRRAKSQSSVFVSDTNFSHLRPVLPPAR